ncbi:MAG: hypothetical protein KAS32_12280 [Candidatus Peribacteraceae bacterium]|nr:hypothetical protein [Candidatus Peribacteraceae bacterium]
MMKYGGKGYKAVDTLQRMGDSARSVFGGRYKFVDDGEGNVYVVKKKVGSKLDYALEEKDFSGKFFGTDNKRLLRKTDKFLRKRIKKAKKGKCEVPQRLSFYVGNSNQLKYNHEASQDAANNLFIRKKYDQVAGTEKIKDVKERNRKFKNIGRDVAVGSAIGGGFLKAVEGMIKIADNVTSDEMLYKALSGTLGDAALKVVLPASTVAMAAGIGMDANIETYRGLRKNMKKNNIGIDFTEKTPNSENFSASIIKINDGDNVRYIAHPHGVGEKPSIDNINKMSSIDSRTGVKTITPAYTEKVFRTYTTSTRDELSGMVNRKLDSLEKSGKSVVSSV